MNDATQKIAAGAVVSLSDYLIKHLKVKLLKHELSDFHAIIQSAIEKATIEHQTEHDRLQRIIEKDTMALMAEKEKSRILGNLVEGLRAAHASKPSWTVLPNGKESRSIDYINPPFRNVTQLVNAHNSTIQPAHASEPPPTCSKCGYHVNIVDGVCTHCGEPIKAAHASEP